jgi:hypothetical protein
VEMVLKEIIEDHHLGVAVVAKAIGVSRQYMYDIVNERKPVSVAVAVRLGKLMATAPAFGARCSSPATFGKPSRKSIHRPLRRFILRVLGASPRGRRLCHNGLRARSNTSSECSRYVAGSFEGGRSPIYGDQAGQRRFNRNALPNIIRDTVIWLAQ